MSNSGVFDAPRSRLTLRACSIRYLDTPGPHAEAVGSSYGWIKCGGSSSLLLFSISLSRFLTWRRGGVWRPGLYGRGLGPTRLATGAWFATTCAVLRFSQVVTRGRRPWDVGPTSSVRTETGEPHAWGPQSSDERKRDGDGVNALKSFCGGKMGRD